MLLKTRFIVYFSVIFLFIAAVSTYSLWSVQTIQNYLRNEVPKAIVETQKVSKLDTIAQLIRYDDEVLTQSARNYAFTGETSWKDRYFEFVPKLDKRIKEAISEGTTQDKEIFESIDKSNIALVEMEEKSITLVDGGKLTSAQKILDGEEYKEQKAIYKGGIEKYLANRGADFDSVTLTTTKTISDIESGLHKLVRNQIYVMVGFTALSFGILVFLVIAIIRRFMNPLWEFKKTAREIIGGNLNAIVNYKNKDEIGEFADDFNKMTSSLRDSLENVEAKVKERTLELEKMNKFMVGRELKMADLKKHINKTKKNV